MADNGDEFWVYGVYLDKEQAEKRANKFQNNTPEIEYIVAEFLGPAEND